MVSLGSVFKAAVSIGSNFFGGGGGPLSYLTAALTAYSYISNKKAAKNAQSTANQAREAAFGVELTNKSTSDSLKYLYGTNKVGNTRVWTYTNHNFILPTTPTNAKSFGNLTSGSGSRNEYLIIQGVIGYDRLADIINVEIDGLLGDNSSILPYYKIFAYTDGGTACPMATVNDGSNNDDRSNSTFNDKAFYTAVFKWDQEKQPFRGIPQIKFNIEGRKCKLIKSTKIEYEAGNYEVTNNPTAHLLDYLISNDINGKNNTLNVIDLPSWKTFSDICDTQTENQVVDGSTYTAYNGTAASPTTGTPINNPSLVSSGFGFKITPAVIRASVRTYIGLAENGRGDVLRIGRQFESTLALSSEDTIRNNVVKAMGGISDANFYYSGGKWKLAVPYAGGSITNNQSTAMLNGQIIEIKDSDIIKNKNIGIVKRSGTERYNQFKVSFRDIRQNFQESSVQWPPRYNSDGTENSLFNQYLTEDNNIPLVGEVFLEGVINEYLATNYCRQQVLTSRTPNEYTLTLIPKYMGLEPGDIIKVNSELNGINSNGDPIYLLIEKINYNTELSVTVQGVQFESSNYGYEDITPEPATGINAANFTVETPTGITYIREINGDYSSVRINWNQGSSLVNKFLIQRSIAPITDIDNFGRFITIGNEPNTSNPEFIDTLLNNGVYIYRIISQSKDSINSTPSTPSQSFAVSRTITQVHANVNKNESDISNPIDVLEDKGHIIYGDDINGLGARNELNTQKDIQEITTSIITTTPNIINRTGNIVNGTGTVTFPSNFDSGITSPELQKILLSGTRSNVVQPSTQNEVARIFINTNAVSAEGTPVPITDPNNITTNETYRVGIPLSNMSYNNNLLESADGAFPFVYLSSNGATYSNGGDTWLNLLKNQTGNSITISNESELINFWVNEATPSGGPGKNWTVSNLNSDSNYLYFDIIFTGTNFIASLKNIMQSTSLYLLKSDYPGEVDTLCSTNSDSITVSTAITSAKFSFNFDLSNSIFNGAISTINIPANLNSTEIANFIGNTIKNNYKQTVTVNGIVTNSTTVVLDSGIGVKTSGSFEYNSVVYHYTLSSNILTLNTNITLADNTELELPTTITFDGNTTVDGDDLYFDIDSGQTNNIAPQLIIIENDGQNLSEYRLIESQGFTNINPGAESSNYTIIDPNGFTVVALTGQVSVESESDKDTIGNSIATVVASNIEASPDWNCAYNSITDELTFTANSQVASAGLWSIIPDHHSFGGDLSFSTSVKTDKVDARSYQITGNNPIYTERTFTGTDILTFTNNSNALSAATQFVDTLKSNNSYITTTITENGGAQTVDFNTNTEENLNIVLSFLNGGANDILVTHSVTNGSIGTLDSILRSNVALQNPETGQDIYNKAIANFSPVLPGTTNRTITTLLTELKTVIDNTGNWNAIIASNKLTNTTTDNRFIENLWNLNINNNGGNGTWTSPGDFTRNQSGRGIPRYYGLRSFNIIPPYSSNAGDYQWFTQNTDITNPAYKVAIALRPRFQFDINPLVSGSGFKLIGSNNLIDFVDLTIETTGGLTNVNPGGTIRTGKTYYLNALTDKNESCLPVGVEAGLPTSSSTPILTDEEQVFITNQFVSTGLTNNLTFELHEIYAWNSTTDTWTKVS